MNIISTDGANPLFFDQCSLTRKEKSSLIGFHFLSHNISTKELGFYISSTVFTATISFNIITSVGLEYFLLSLNVKRRLSVRTIHRLDRGSNTDARFLRNGIVFRRNLICGSLRSIFGCLLFTFFWLRLFDVVIDNITK